MARKHAIAMHQKSEPLRAEPDPIRIYVACLAVYNNGHLHGRWIEVADECDIQAEVTAMLDASPIEMAEEWAIHDYEGFEGVELSEYVSFARVVELAEFIQERGKLGAEVLAYYGGDLEDANSAFENYAGVYGSLEDYAREITEGTTEIPDNLSFYIDYAKMARDMEVNDVLTFETAFNEIHVFYQW